MISTSEKQKCALSRVCVIKPESNNFIGVIKSIFYKFDTVMIFYKIKSSPYVVKLQG